MWNPTTMTQLFPIKAYIKASLIKREKGNLMIWIPNLPKHNLKSLESWLEQVKNIWTKNDTEGGCEDLLAVIISIV